MNKSILSGRPTRDPKISYSGEMAIAKWVLAVNRKKKGEADFISCVAFGKTAEFVEKYIKKGMKVDLSGRIQTGSYENREGQKVYTTDVVVEEIEFGESKKEEPKTEEPKTEPDDFMNVPDDIDSELPFN